MSKHLTIFIEDQGDECNVKVYTSPDMDSRTLATIKRSVNHKQINRLIETGINNLKAKEAKA